MRDILQDIVAHTHALGFLETIKITSDEDTYINSNADDNSVIMYAKTHNIVPEFSGVFGMTNLEKLNLHLKNPEYKDNTKIEVVQGERNGEVVPTHIHFENEAGDFQNDYRFMSKTVVEEKIKILRFAGANWDVVFQPSIASIQRMRLMSAAHTEESNFSVSTKDTGGATDLIFSFGDLGAHAGEFVFEANVNGKLAQDRCWPVDQVQKLLGLGGDITMSISGQDGVMQISVDSGLTKYDYLLVAQVK